MIRTLLQTHAAMLLMPMAALFAADLDPQAVFQNPPGLAKPGVLWMWMGSNISREGITRDLEALKAAGFNRTTMFSLADATTPPLERPILFHHLELLHQRLAAHSLRPARPGDDYHQKIIHKKTTRLLSLAPWMSPSRA